jgi:hypothetical protein
MKLMKRAIKSPFITSQNTWYNSAINPSGPVIYYVPSGISLFHFLHQKICHEHPIFLLLHLRNIIPTLLVQHNRVLLGVSRTNFCNTMLYTFLTLHLCEDFHLEAEKFATSYVFH